MICRLFVIAILGFLLGCGESARGPADSDRPGDALGRGQESRISYRSLIRVRVGEDGEFQVEEQLLEQSKDLGGCSELIASADGQRYAYWSEMDDRSRLIIDGEPGPWFDFGQLPFFRSQDNRLVYLGKRDGKWHLIWDGQEIAEYDQLGIQDEDGWNALVAASQGNRIAFTAGRQGSRFVVVDGVEVGEYEGIVRKSLRFSPDGKRIAYFAKRNEKYFVVVDGEEGPEYESVTLGTPIFIPDS